MSFQSRLLDARKRAGLTQAQVAERIGVAKSTYTGYERGTNEPDMRKTAMLMRLLGVDANYLWQDEMIKVGAQAMALSEEAFVIAKSFDRLDQHGQRVVAAVVDLEIERCAAALADLNDRQKQLIDDMRSVNAEREA